MILSVAGVNGAEAILLPVKAADWFLGSSLAKV